MFKIEHPFVKINDAADTAFVKAVFVTKNGSIIPISYISPAFPVLKLIPCQSSDLESTSLKFELFFSILKGSFKIDFKYLNKVLE